MGRPREASHAWQTEELKEVIHRENLLSRDVLASFIASKDHCVGKQCNYLCGQGYASEQASHQTHRNDGRIAAAGMTS